MARRLVQPRSSAWAFHATRRSTAPTPHHVLPHRGRSKDLQVHSEEVHEDRLGGDFLVTTTPLTGDRDELRLGGRTSPVTSPSASGRRKR